MKNLNNYLVLVKNTTLETNYTKIDNKLLSSSLNLNIIGLIAVLESLPNNWRLNLNFISKKYNIPYRTLWRLYNYLLKENLLIIENDKIYINYQKIYTNEIIKVKKEKNNKTGQNDILGQSGILCQNGQQHYANVANTICQNGQQDYAKVANNLGQNGITIKTNIKTDRKTIIKTNNQPSQGENFSITADTINYSQNIYNIIGDYLNKTEQEEFFKHVLENKLVTDNSILNDNHPLSIRISIIYKKEFPNENKTELIVNNLSKFSTYKSNYINWLMDERNYSNEQASKLIQFSIDSKIFNSDETFESNYTDYINYMKKINSSIESELSEEELLEDDIKEII